jgi:hypothetical protein
MPLATRQITLVYIRVMMASFTTEEGMIMITAYSSLKDSQ